MDRPRGDDVRDFGVPTPRRSAVEGDGLDPVYDNDVPIGRRHADPEEPHRHLFTRALVATGLSALVPGLGLIRSRRRWLGVGITATFVGLVVALAIGIALDFDNVAAIAVRPKTLTAVSIALVTAALLWVAVIVGTHLIARPPRLTSTQRVIGALAVGGLSFLVSAPLAVAARYAYDQGHLVNSVFKSGNDVRSQTKPTDLDGGASDPWASKPRLNIMLLGGDTTDETGGVRTDTIMVASIDTQTGNTTIFQIPRNTGRMPFPADSELAKVYPNGFYDGVSGENLEYMANAIWKNVPLSHPELFTDTDQPGADALKMAVGEALGLQIDYFLMLRIDGLVKLINAMGGITLNVNERIPLAGSKDHPGLTKGYIEIGANQKLNGYQAMWYARARYTSANGDNSRMGRQTCVVKAIIDQADPATMLTKYESIAKASQDLISTDLPQEILPAMVTLALRVRDGTIRRYLFATDKDGFQPWDPDFDAMRAKVKTSLEESSAEPPASAAPTATSTAKPSTSSSSRPSSAGSPSSSPSTTSENLDDVCAFNPPES